jgi:hypothetical protein
MTSGYTCCGCRDCFDVAISADMRIPDLCTDCAGYACDPLGRLDCERYDAYDCEPDLQVSDAKYAAAVREAFKAKGPLA